MAAGRRRNASAPGDEKDPTAVEEPIIILDDPSSESEVATLRRRWELASVLNFLTVFEPVLDKDFNVSAEEIEMGLIQSNSSLARLHIILLKGIPPVSKNLNNSESGDAWVTILCKKLAPWWPWVAEGEIPLKAANGEEISRYKELSPTNRLLILKALCELRAEQDDTRSYINDSLKDGTEISSFRKDEIGGDGNQTSYWCDGNAVTGYRLYKEVKIESLTELKGKRSTLPAISWETIATNLEEFRKVAEELASNKIPSVVAVGKSIEADPISVLESIVKKKERALKRKQRQEMRLNDSKSFCCPRITRSCRSRRPVSYTYDEYDRAINEAIQQTKKGETYGDRRQETNHRERGERTSSVDINPKGSSGSEGDSENGGSEQEQDLLQQVDNEYVEDSDSENKVGFIAGSRRLDLETRRPGTAAAAKNRLRQRPTRNAALDTVVVPDSDDDMLYAAEPPEKGTVDC